MMLVGVAHIVDLHGYSLIRSRRHTDCSEYDTLMSILTTEMDDKHDYISWWLYESTEDKTVTWIENGVERSVDLTTPEALYDYIVESHLERERDERS